MKSFKPTHIRSKIENNRIGIQFKNETDTSDIILLGKEDILYLIGECLQGLSMLNKSEGN